jgi:ATP-binding cassette subfamily B protein
VIVLDDGQIVEDGIPEELLKRDGPFKALWQAQAMDMQGI